jgi:putative sugar O-methyltransferase
MPPDKPGIFDRIKAPLADRASDVLVMLLRLGGPNAYLHTVNALWERQPVSAKYDVKLCVSEEVEPDPSERPLVERIFAAFRQAKLAQAKQDPIFLPAGSWKNVLDSAYTFLSEGYENHDIDRFHYFLANFGAWKQPTGIGESWVFSRLRESARKRRHFEQYKMPQLIQWWQTFESNGRSLSELTMPTHGNQGGALVDGHRILPESIFSEIHSRLLAGFVQREQPLIAELGGGFGRLCYFLSRQIPTMTYVGLDLPECLCLATYYLMMSFPERRFLLYGEADLTPESHSEFDFILRPSFEITRIQDQSVDLFINENSLGMVPSDACRLFVREICRSTMAFWHRNSEVRRSPAGDGTKTLVNSEYPVDREHFQEVVRYCDVARMVGHDRSKIKSDMYWYYFRRMERRV